MGLIINRAGHLDHFRHHTFIHRFFGALGKVKSAFGHMPGFSDAHQHPHPQRVDVMYGLALGGVVRRAGVLLALPLFGFVGRVIGHYRHILA
jgi:hypothetical protein